MGKSALILMAFVVAALVTGCSWFVFDQPDTVTPEASPTEHPAATPTPAPEPTSAPRPAPQPTTQPTPSPAPAPSPTPHPPLDVITIRKADTSEKIIALTFDAGADRGYAAMILDTLRDEGIRATFGMTGVWAEQNADLVRRIAGEGHQLINHTYDHPSFTGYSTGKESLGREARISQLTRNEDVVAKILGHESMRPYFRPPYGDYDQAVLDDIALAGYSVNVMWSVDSLGWKGLTADEIVARCVDGAEPGGIILMHVGAASQDAHALPDIIRELRAQGYRFVTVEQMVAR
jgi:peptidoglycan-N-acetylglucosamine deacetylase